MIGIYRYWIILKVVISSYCSLSMFVAVPNKIYKMVRQKGTMHYAFVLLRFNVSVNNFSVMSGRSHRFLGLNQYSRELMCLAQGHNTVTLVGIEPRTSRFGVRRSTTRPPRSLIHYTDMLKEMKKELTHSLNKSSTEAHI